MEGKVANVTNEKMCIFQSEHSQVLKDMANKLNHNDLELAKLSGEVRHLAERVDRHGEVAEKQCVAINKIADTLTEQLKQHHATIYGSSEKEGVLFIAESNKIKLNDLEKSRNGWLDWTFRIFITLLLGWIAANIQMKPIHQSYKEASQGVLR